MDFSVNSQAENGKHGEKDLTIFGDWFDNGKLKEKMVREFLTDRVTPDTPVIVSVGRKAANGYPDGGHSIIIKKIQFEEVFLQSKFFYLDTLDGINLDSTRSYTLEEAFITGMEGLRSVEGRVYIYGTYYFV